MITRTLPAAVLGVLFSTFAFAQSRPDFSGTWNAPGSPLTITIRQDDRTLTIGQGPDARIYNLDGSDSHFQATGRIGVSQLTAHARWVGAALVIATTTVSPIGTWEDLEVYSLDYGSKLSVVQVGTQTTSPMMSTTVKTYTKS
jgi:hypothetical protein